MPSDAARGLFLAFLLFGFCGLALLLLAVANLAFAPALWGTFLLALATALAWRLRDQPLRALLP